MYDHAVIVQFKNSGGIGTAQERWARHRQEVILDDVLKLHHLGYCEGGATGAGTMEIFLFVHNLEPAIAAVKQALTDLKLIGEAKIAGCPSGADEVTVYHPKEAKFSIWEEWRARNRNPRSTREERARQQGKQGFKKVWPRNKR